MPIQCTADCGKKAILKRPKTGDALCKDCFYFAFETEIHFTIVKGKLFKKGNRIELYGLCSVDDCMESILLLFKHSRFLAVVNLFLTFPFIVLTINNKDLKQTSRWSILKSFMSSLKSDPLWVTLYIQYVPTKLFKVYGRLSSWFDSDILRHF